jgi:predicted RNase H-related nuclease YkuK (DUF458 family)
MEICKTSYVHFIIYVGNYKSLTNKITQTVITIINGNGYSYFINTGFWEMET